MNARLIKLCYEKNDKSLFSASKLLRALFDFAGCYSLSEWYVDKDGLQIKKEEIPNSQVKCIILLTKDKYNKNFSNYEVTIDYMIHGNFYGHILNDNVVLVVFNDKLTSVEKNNINNQLLELMYKNDKKYYNHILNEIESKPNENTDYHRTYLLFEYFFNKFLKENQLT